MRQAPARSLLRLLCGGVLLASTGCSRKHEGPEVGDSVTNWLRSCASDADCPGAATCIRALCSIPCSDQHADGCDVLSRDAVCDSDARRCDLPCASTSVCSALRAGLTCSAGRCREQDSEAVLSSKPVLSSGPTYDIPSFDVPLQPAPDLPTARPNMAGDKLEGVFDPGVSLDLEPVAAQPQGIGAAWQGDHWLVTWSMLEDWWEEFPRIRMARIYAEGRYELERIGIPFNVPGVLLVYFSDDGRLAVSGRGPEDGSCTIAVSDLATGTGYVPASFPCESPLDWLATAVPGSDDWLLTWHSHTEESGASSDVLVARYDPTRASWSAGPWLIHEERRSSAAIGAGRESAYAWSAFNGGDGYLYRLPDLARADLPSAAFVAPVSALPTGGGNVYRGVPLTNGIMLVKRDSIGLNATVVSDDGTSTGPEPIFDPTGGNPGAFYTINTLYLPERRQVALCSTGQNVQLLLLDERGKTVLGPLTFASGSSFVTCDLAWSGRDLLLAWALMVEDGESQAPVSARIIRAADLGG